MTPVPTTAAAPNTHDFDEIVRTQRGRVSRALLRFGVAPRDLPDAEQDVFMVVLRRLHEFEGRASISTWVYRIAMNVASDHRRRAHHRRELVCEERVAQAPSTAACEVEQRETRARLAEAVQALEQDKREVFLLYELEELPMAEIAAKQRVPLKTAFSRLYAARRTLLGALRAQGFAFLALWQTRRVAHASWLAAPIAACVWLMPALPEARVEHAAVPASATLVASSAVAHAREERPPLMAADASPVLPTRPVARKRAASSRTASSAPVAEAPAPASAPASAELVFSAVETGSEELRPRILPDSALPYVSSVPALPRIVVRGPLSGALAER